MSIYFVSKESAKIMELDKLDLMKVADSSKECVLDSIYKGCGGYYPKEFLDRWTSNKTKENIFGWFGNKENDAFIFTEEDSFDVKGLLLVQDKRNILLLYVHPNFMGTGIGGLLLEALVSAFSPRELHANATINSVNWYLSKEFEVVGNVNIENDILVDIPVRRKPSYYE